MANLGAHHSLISQILVATLLAGLPVYLLTFFRRLAPFRPLASLLLLVGTVATFVAVASGMGAGVEPGPHADMGERARNIFAGVLILELIALGLARHAGPAGASVLEVESGSLDAVGASTKRFAATTLRVLVALAWTLGALHVYDTMAHGKDLAAAATAAAEGSGPSLRVGASGFTPSSASP